MFHFLARALISSNEQILLVREVGADYFFLPGGHIETGEGARHALQRELREELGIEAEAGTFRGAVEHKWWRDADLQTELQTELNLLFEVSAPQLNALATPLSRESHIEFRWVKLTELKSVNLLPAPLLPLIINRDQSGHWGSSYEEPSQ